MSILDNISFELQQNFYMNQEKLIRATLYETINLWFHGLNNVIRTWKWQFSSSALLFFIRVKKEEKAKFKKVFVLIFSIFSLRMLHVA